MEQPFSSISNVAYAWAGTWVLTRALAPEHVLFGVALLFLSVGSFLYHALPKSRNGFPTWGQRMDEIGMYAVLASMGTIGVSVLLPGGYWVHAGVLLIFALAWTHLELHSATMVPAMSALVLVQTGFIAGIWPGVLLAAGLLAAAKIRAIGERQYHELLHSTWHLLGAGLIGYWFHAVAL